MSEYFERGILSEDIVREVKNLIKEDVILTNNKGLIVASSDPTRVDEFHEGALKAIENKENLVMTDELTKELKGVRQGIVLPILIQEQAYGCIGITGEPELIKPFAMLVRKVTELFVRDSINRLDEERQAREVEFFIFDWLNSDQITKDMTEKSNFYNLSMYSYERVIVLDTKDKDYHFTYKEIKMLKDLWDLRQTLIIRWGQDRVLFLIEQEEELVLKSRLKRFKKELEKLFEESVAIGVGQPQRSENLKVSLKQAERACAVSLKTKDIVFDGDLRLELLQQVLDSSVKREFVRRTINPIKGQDVYLETISAWFKNDLSRHKTAEYLYIHKNTLDYRLRKVEQLTDLDLRSVHHITLLYLGYRFLYEDTKKRA
ncbi:CdaR family transcriptional regulator [Alkalibacillus haloalkaliphilus]|uniref:CdaR family transcriptional regulator n=1 Tax=Alkalibacillus haloalkaliphilus TaxID=94136 RepID=UPI002935DAF0|nr:sugar diacid recognition domain-containing protein [Alkalibacillus haloalkaliphilus]MDV2582223.1 sugar diacid recognition domain-containing protein [Alkalibacillus haloalkaliphilus]